FFFQAEDGIRDFHVTGVQTCALPISAPLGSRPFSKWRFVLFANPFEKYESCPTSASSVREASGSSSFYRRRWVLKIRTLPLSELSCSNRRRRCLCQISSSNRLFQ